MSILSHLHQIPQEIPPSIKLIYSSRPGPTGSSGSILFLSRIRRLFNEKGISSVRSLELFYTSTTSSESEFGSERNKASVPPKLGMASTHPQRICFGRIAEEDLLSAVGPLDKRGGTVAYVCGPPPMADWVAAKLKGFEGMSEERILCEKWW